MARDREILKSDVHCLAALKTACLHLDMYIHEIGLHVPKQHSHLSRADGQKCCSWCSSPLRADIATSAIRAAQRFIDAYVQFTDDQLRHNTLMEEAKLLYAILILSTVSIEQTTRQLDSARLRDLTNMYYYIGAVEKRFATLVTTHANGQERHDYFWQMKHHAAITIAWFDKYIEGLVMGHNRREECGEFDLSIMKILIRSASSSKECEQALDEAAFSEIVDTDTSWMVDQNNLWPDLT